MVVTRDKGPAIREPGTRTIRRLRGAWVALALAAPLAGCATGTEGQAIYIKQHQVSIALTQALISATEVDDPRMMDALYNGEDALNTACAPLQEAGYKALNKEAVGPLLELKAFYSLETCKTRTREIEDLLWRIDPKTAHHYLGRPLVSVKSEK